MWRLGSELTVPIAASLCKSTQREVSQTWKVQSSLLSMALKAHEWKGDSDKNNLSKDVSSFLRYFFTGKVRNSNPLTMPNPRGGRKALGIDNSQVRSYHSDNATTPFSRNQKSMQRSSKVNPQKREVNLWRVILWFPNL